MRKHGEQSKKIKQALISSGDLGISLPQIVEQTGCSKTNAATLLKGWTETGHVLRTGKRTAYRYFYTGLNFAPKNRYNVTKKVSYCRRKIRQAIFDFNGSCFSAGDIIKATGINSANVCGYLAGLTEKGILQRRGNRKNYIYCKVNIIPDFFSEAELAELIFNVLYLSQEAFSKDEIVEMVVAGLESQSLYGKEKMVKNTVRHVVECWHRDNVLACLCFDEDPPLFKLKPDIKKRPVHVWKQ